MTHRSSEAGFTLVEILVAIFAFSLMMGAGSFLLVTTLNAQDLVDQRLERLGELELASAHLRADLANSIPRIVSTGRISDRPRSLFGGEPDRDGVVLALVRDGWTNLDASEERSELLSVEYRLEDDQLVRRLYERVDPTRRTPRFETILLQGVDRVDLEFIAGGVSAPRWDLALEAGLPRLPDAVRVGIEFENGDVLRQSFLIGGRS